MNCTLVSTPCQPWLQTEDHRSLSTKCRLMHTGGRLVSPNHSMLFYKGPLEPSGLLLNNISLGLKHAVGAQNGTPYIDMASAHADSVYAHVRSYVYMITLHVHVWAYRHTGVHKGMQRHTYGPSAAVSRRTVFTVTLELQAGVL